MRVNTQKKHPILCARFSILFQNYFFFVISQSFMGCVFLDFKLKSICKTNCSICVKRLLFIIEMMKSDQNRKWFFSKRALKWLIDDNTINNKKKIWRRQQQQQQQNSQETENENKLWQSAPRQAHIDFRSIRIDCNAVQL